MQFLIRDQQLTDSLIGNVSVGLPAKDCSYQLHVSGQNVKEQLSEGEKQRVRMLSRAEPGCNWGYEKEAVMSVHILIFSSYG